MLYYIEIMSSSDKNSLNFLSQGLLYLIISSFVFLLGFGFAHFFSALESFSYGYWEGQAFNYISTSLYFGFSEMFPLIVSYILFFKGVRSLKNGFVSFTTSKNGVKGTEMYYYALIMFLFFIVLFLLTNVFSLIYQVSFLVIGLTTLFIFFLLLGTLFLMIGNVFVGSSFYFLGEEYKEIALKIGGILTAIPGLCVLGYILSWVGLENVKRSK